MRMSASGFLTPLISSDHNRAHTDTREFPLTLLVYVTIKVPPSVLHDVHEDKDFKQMKGCPFPKANRVDESLHLTKTTLKSANLCFGGF